MYTENGGGKMKYFNWKTFILDYCAHFMPRDGQLRGKIFNNLS